MSEDENRLRELMHDGERDVAVAHVHGLLPRRPERHRRSWAASAAAVLVTAGIAVGIAATRGSAPTGNGTAGTGSASPVKHPERVLVSRSPVPKLPIQPKCWPQRPMPAGTSPDNQLLCPDHERGIPGPRPVGVATHVATHQ